MIAQATVNGALSADYAIVVLIGIIASLFTILMAVLASYFISVVKDIRASLSTMHQSLTVVESNHSDLETEHRLLAQRVDSFDSKTIAEQVFAKLQALRDMK